MYAHHLLSRGGKQITTSEDTIEQEDTFIASFI
jgi:hypothetical protein